MKKITSKVVKMENGLENNFGRAQSILDTQSNTSLIDAEMYVNRKYDTAVTFEIALENDREYRRFINRLVRDGYTNKDVTEEYTPTFDEWKEGKTVSGQRLGRFLRRLKYSQELLDFYSTQEKDEKDEIVYLTISPLVQHVVGMSYYNNGTWSSCQDVSYNSNSHYPLHLGGSILDSHLYIAFVHDDKDDMYSFRARTVLRLFELESYDVFIGTDIYGDRGVLTSCLDLLNDAGYNIFTNDRAKSNVSYDDSEVLEQELDVIAEYEVEGNISVWYESEETGIVKVECQICSGYGDVTIDGDGNEVQCPHCGGYGTVEEEITHYVAEEVETYMYYGTFNPYDEGYSHGGYYATMRVNMDTIEENENKNIYG